MKGKGETRPPRACRLLMWLGAALAPEPQRAVWRSHWETGLLAGWLLAQRGEMPGDEQALLTEYCRAAFRDALWLRLSRPALLAFARGPLAVVLSVLALLGGLAAASHGFQTTRHLIGLALHYQPAPPSRHYDSVADLLVGYSVPVLAAWAIALALAWIERIPLRSYRWTYGTLLAAKALLPALWLPLAWIEGGAALRAALPGEGMRVLLGGLLPAVALLGLSGLSVSFILADQRRRCPVCLSLMEMPVTFGSWASMFEPVSTEMLCPLGHGSLSVPEAEIGAPDHWQQMDASWHELFSSPAGR